MATEPTGYFKTRRSREYGYDHFFVEIFQDRGGYSSPIAELKWQADSDSKDESGNRNWYGFHVSVNGNHIEDLTRAAKLLRCISDYPKSNTPQNALEIMEKHGFKQVIRDERICQYVPVDEIKPGRGWQDDNIAAGYDYATITVIAEDETSARAELARELVHYSMDKLQKWAAAGCPISSYKSAPEYISWQVLAILD